MGTIEKEKLPSGIVTRLLRRDGSSNAERAVYRLRQEEVPAQGARLLDVVMKAYDPAISAEQLGLYKEVTNRVAEEMKDTYYGGVLGEGIINDGAGIKFRWEGSPIIRIQRDGATLQTVSEYRAGVELDVLCSLQGEALREKFKNLEVREQMILMGLAEQVFSQKSQMALLEEDMERVSARLCERIGVAGIHLTKGHTRAFVLPTGYLILGATDVARSVNDIQGILVPEAKLWPEGDI